MGPSFPETVEELYEDAPYASIYTTFDGRITHVNRSLIRWTGFERQALVARMRFPDLLQVGGKIFYETHFLPMLQMHGEVREIALDLACRDGSAYPVLVTAVQKRDAAGAVLFNRLTLFSATERRRYEDELLSARKQAENTSEQLRALNGELAESERRLWSLNNELEAEVKKRTQALIQAERELEQARKLEALGRLAGGVAHDFNNIVAGISGVSRELQAESVPGTTLHTDLGEIMKASEKAFALTKQLLAVGRRQMSRPKDVDLNSVIQDGLEMLQRMVGEPIRLVFRPEPVRAVHIDPVQLEQILMNLVLNARDAMPDGGEIAIRTEEIEGLHAQLEVIDHGSGMEPEVMAHIFEPFFTTKERGLGTGLGLATVYGIVKQNGGSIDVTSAPHQGAKFSVRLPIAESKGAVE